MDGMGLDLRVGGGIEHLTVLITNIIFILIAGYHQKLPVEHEGEEVGI